MKRSPVRRRGDHIPSGALSLLAWKVVGMKKTEFQGIVKGFREAVQCLGSALVARLLERNGSNPSRVLVLPKFGYSKMRRDLPSHLATNKTRRTYDSKKS